MRLSESFTLREFTFSETNARAGREIVPTTLQVENATRLCQTLLQPIRDRIVRPIVVTSGIRDEWTNTAVGGAPRSAHLEGRAVDCRAVGMTATMFARWIRVNGFMPDKCIDEFGRWVHIQIARPGSAPRGEFLLARRVDGRTVYTRMPE